MHFRRTALQPDRRASRLIAGAAAVLIALLGTLASAPAAAVAPIAFPAELRYHGLLEGIPGPDVASSTAQVLSIDDQRRLLYTVHNDISEGFGPTSKLVLNSYDLSAKGVPPLLKSRVVAGTNGMFGGNREPYSTVFDAGRRQVLISGTGNSGAKIERLDVAKGKALAPFDVTAEVPGFSAVGMTYAKAEDRLYLLGELTGTAAVGPLAAIAGAYRGATAVVALDAATGKRLWVRPIPECRQPLVSFAVGSLLARSELREALYFFCQPGSDSFGAVGARYPGQSALIRLNIAAAAEQAQAADFSTDVFPVSGGYQDISGTGIGAFDPATDRVLIQSRAKRTPGAWVFDGRLDAWVGFITAPDANNRFIAVNPRTGRHYMGGQVEAGAPPSAAYLNISDSRLSPVPQGQTIPLVDGTGLGDGATGLVRVDPSTSRLFTNRIGKAYQIAVIEDTTPVQTVDESPNLDVLTSDVRITDTTLVQYSGGAAGYGANLRVVGGLSGGYSGLPGSLLRDTGRTNGVDGAPPCASVGVDDVSCVSGGDRQLTIGAVPSVDLRNSGASAAATSLEVDGNTDGERDGARRAVRNRTDGEDDGASSALGPAFGRVDCLDGGNDRQAKDTPSHPLGTAHVVCDLARESVRATSEFGSIAGQPLAISSSSFETQTWRTRQHRAVTESVAAARGVRIGDAAGPNVVVGAVRTTTTTTAGGRPGTATATWERSLSAVTAHGPDGAEVLNVPGCATRVMATGARAATVTEDGNCAALVAQLNEVLTGQAELRLPQPEIVATPKGAFAAINKPLRDFLQASTLQNDDRRALPGLEAIVFNDGEEKSRVVAQFAGVEANSIFLISDFGAPGPWTTDPPAQEQPGTSGPGGKAGTGGKKDGGRSGAAGGGAGGAGTSAGGPALDDAAAGPPVDDPLTAGADGALAAGTGGPVARLAEGLRWLARSPGEAALVGALWLLFAGALMTALRRGLLLRALQS